MVYFFLPVAKHGRRHKLQHEPWAGANAAKPEREARIGDRGATIIYDGECPFCSAYVGLVRLREAVGPVALVDARLGGPEVAAVVAAGYDLDEGMVLKLDGVLYHGDDCLNRLALLSTRSGVFNRVTAALFSQPSIARLAYPALRSGRNLALRLLGRQRIAAVPAPRGRVQ